MPSHVQALAVAVHVVLQYVAAALAVDQGLTAVTARAATAHVVTARVVVMARPAATTSVALECVVGQHAARSVMNVVMANASKHRIRNVDASIGVAVNACLLSFR